MINKIHDLTDSEGRTYKQVNMSRSHRFNVGDLVELDNGSRLFVAKLTRDCDLTPLYSLTHETREDGVPLNEVYWVHGIPEKSIKPA